MEIFRLIIDLVDKIVWPATVLIIFFFLRYPLINLINSILSILEKRGGEIKTPWGEVILLNYKEGPKSVNEVK